VTRISQDENHCVAHQLGQIVIAEDFENRFPDVDWKYQLQNHNKAILFRITGKTLQKDAVKNYFERQNKQIRSEQLT